MPRNVSGVGNLLAKLFWWAVFVAVITTVGGWWGMAMIVAIALIVYLAVGRRSRSG